VCVCVYIYIYIYVCVCVCVCDHGAGPFWAVKSSKTSHDNAWNLGTRGFFTIFTIRPLLILRQLNPIHTIQIYVCKKIFYIYLPIYGWDIQADSFLLVSPTKILYAFFHSPTRAVWPFYPTVRHLITLKIFGEKYKPRNSSLCCVLHPPVPPSPPCPLLGQNIFEQPILDAYQSVQVWRAYIRIYIAAFSLVPYLTSRQRWWQ